MDEQCRKRLEERNNRIIQALLQKIDRICAGSVDMIGITGSFCTGDIHEKSDLDLLIVINDDRAWSIACGFIVDGVGFDIYCSKWDSLETMAAYTNPYVGKLIDLDIVYNIDAECKDRYLGLRRKILEALDAPLCEEDIAKAREFFRQAEMNCLNSMLADDLSSCRQFSSIMLYYVEFSIYMINKRYVKHGIKRIPEEIQTMMLLPERFTELHEAVFRADNIDGIKDACKEMILAMRRFFEGFNSKDEKRELTVKDLKGTYEEIYSNWRNKVYHSADINSAYLSFSTISSCQYFYDSMFDAYNIDHIDVVKEYYPPDLARTAVCFDKSMEEYKKLYEALNVRVANYDCIEDFEKDYLAD